jgi:hypothetical protein
MNVLLQIALGMIPAFIVLLIVTLIGRKQVLPKIIAMGLTLAVGVGSAVGYFVSQTPEDRAKQINTGDSVKLVYALMAQGQSKQADDLLDELMTGSVYSSEYSLAKARIYALQGNYVPAKGMYDKVIAQGMSSKDVLAERELAAQCVTNQNVDMTLLEQDSN